jgi:ClpP class serine protease
MFDHPNPIVLVVALVLLAILFASFIWMRRSDVIERVKANEQFTRRQQKDYSKAKSELDELKREIERKTNGSMVIDLVHDFGEFRYERDNTSDHVNFEQAIDVMNAVRSARKNGPIVVILHTLGGYSLAAELVAAALKAHPGPTAVYVPYIAMSAGTLIALAADKIHLGKNACLGPIDTQYAGRSFQALKELLEFKKERASDDELLTYFEAKVREKTIRERVLAIMDGNHKERAIDALLREDLSHDHRITFDEAEKIGLKVSNECPKEVYLFTELRFVMLKRYKEAIQLAAAAESHTSWVRGRR